MLTIYRRHQKGCKHRSQGRKHRHCQCVIWVDGILTGVEIRESLKMRDWQRAQEKIRAWEAQDRRTVQPEAKMIDAAWTEFLADLEARKLADSTIRKYKLLKRQMQDFAKKRGFRFLIELDLPAVSQFRAGWHDGPRSSAKKLERLRAFLRFAMKRKWVPDNPAADLRAPRITLCPTMPFTQAEMLRILAAIDKYKDEFPGRGAENARRMRALVLLLRYTGMRIGDATSLTVERIDGNKLFLYTQKTGVPVNTVLPGFVVKALDATPKTTEKHFFWDGALKLETIVRQLAEEIRAAFRTRESGERSSSPLPGHFRCRATPDRRAYRTRLRFACASKCSYHRTALFALGTLSTGAIGS
jgi:integrase/recombinase XerD